ncbi:MAG: hypothetical protein Q8M39_05230 [Sulfuricurvum sp.]|nr:hypothetical protein [Sulfuricurvum sp.]
MSKKVDVNLIVLNIVKVTILIYMLFLLCFGLFIPFSRMMSIFMYTAIFFLMASIGIYTFFTNEKDSELMMSMWKLYFPVISLMFIFMYTMDNTAHQMRIDYYKTKVLMESKTNSTDMNATFKTYTQRVDQYLDSYKNEEVNLSEILHSTKKSEVDNTRNFYGNFALLVINMMTSFMVLWMLKELSFFQKKKSVTKPMKHKVTGFLSIRGSNKG